MQVTQSRNQLASRRGSSMIEFALIFSLLLMLFFGIFEMGRTIWSYNTVAFAARQAARYAIVRSDLGGPSAPTPNPIDNVVYQNAPGLISNRISITKKWLPDNSRGSQFEIKVEYPVDLIAFQLFLPNTSQIKVSSTSTYTILN